MNGKLHGITALEIYFSRKKQLSISCLKCKCIRKEEVVLARLHLGHTRVTHSYLLGEEQPQCVGCDAPFTVRHFLLECGNFAQVRNNCFNVDNMEQLFQDIHIDYEYKDNFKRNISF